MIPKIAKRPEKNQNFKIGEICNFLPAFAVQVLSPNAQSQPFWAKIYQLSNLLAKFCLYPISKVLIENLTFIFENLEPKFGHFESKGFKFLILSSFACTKVLISDLLLLSRR